MLEFYTGPWSQIERKADLHIHVVIILLLTRNNKNGTECNSESGKYVWNHKRHRFHPIFLIQAFRHSNEPISNKVPWIEHITIGTL